MALLYISERGKRLLDVLLAQRDYITISNLTKALDVSRRTVYYDISKVNIWLKQAGISELEIVREKGLFIPYKDREAILQYVEENNEATVYVFSPEEREKGIICALIYSDKPVYLEQISEYFDVSRNTVFKDLKMVSKRLEQYELELDYHPKTGYQIKGDTVRVRALFMLYFNEMSSLFQNGAMKFFDLEKVESYYMKLKNIEEELKVRYVEGTLLAMSAMIPLLFRHRRSVSFPGLKIHQMQETTEYELVEKYFSQLVTEEKCYLAMHLCGSRVNTVPPHFYTNPSRQYIRDLVKEMIALFEKMACVIFEDPKELERNLFVHLGTSLFRYQYGIQIGNMLGNDVIKEYPNLFSITRAVSKKLEESIGVPIPDSEVAYLALHFGSTLKIAEKDGQRLRILIVCVNGISTGNMIKREVQKLLPFAEIVDVRAMVDILNVQDICDLIISTVKINTIVPTIVVHPILTELDRKNILNHRLIAPKEIEIRRDQIFQVIKKYVSPEDYENLKDDLMAYLQGGIQEFSMEDKLELNLCKLLDILRVKIIPEKCNWQQSIRMAGQYLVDCGSIDQHYLDTIIMQLQYYGPYMFLSDSVLLAHAKPEDGVNTLDVSLTVFKEPVPFAGGRRAELIIVLAAEDQEKHLTILQDILEIVSDEEKMKRLLACTEEEKLLGTVFEMLSNEK
ncbi:MAG: PRD domain-containing protein [Lachnospiraceae bacterium]|nr:PRD domain-containing protein [Lachnospiraceae bacterium]